MAGITLAVADAKLQEWLAAESAVAKSQSYSIGNRSLSRVDAGEIREKIEYWNNWVTRLGGGNSRRRSAYVVPE